MKPKPEKPLKKNEFYAAVKRGVVQCDRWDDVIAAKSRCEVFDWYGDDPLPDGIKIRRVRIEVLK